MSNPKVDDAFNSMLRTDYIALRDTAKLNLLADYYVDFYGFLRQVQSESDQLIVGRRGTGKTTLLYRVLVECMRSWDPQQQSIAKPRTLAIYIDLNKCQALSDVQPEAFADFEHVFVSEFCDAIAEEISRSWPVVNAQPGFFAALFNSAAQKKATETKVLLRKLATVLQSGLPRVIDRSGKVDAKEIARTKTENEISASAKVSEKPAFSVGAKNKAEIASEEEQKFSYSVSFRLTIADVLQILGELRDAAGIPAVFLLIDEFSALSEELQRRFTTLLKKLIGNHSGLFIKLCGITDKYTLGSSLILQRDLFELSLDLDAFVERSDSLNAAMTEMDHLTEQIVTERIRVYAQLTPKQIFEDPTETWREMSRSAMGVPRTLGIVLKQAWSRASQTDRRIKKSDVDYGIRYASRAYLDQLEGASKGGVALPAYVSEIWDAVLSRAVAERSKGAEASHFMVLPKNEIRLKYLSMCFVVHLLTKGRTTKKDKSARSLYCIDYGICLENNLGFATDKNILRQHRFAFDAELEQFDSFFEKVSEPKYICPACGDVYRESELLIRGTVMSICVKDHSPLNKHDLGALESRYTEEEIKIIGSIRSSSLEDQLIARQVADDVGCHVQKVSKFGEKLEREGIITRARIEELRKNIYYGSDGVQE
jgi:hypothetical protein